MNHPNLIKLSYFSLEVEKGERLTIKIKLYLPYIENKNIVNSLFSFEEKLLICKQLISGTKFLH